MANEEDFSFPATLEHFSRCGIDSPPLWRLSPAASPISLRSQTPDNQNRGERTEDGGYGGNNRIASDYLVKFPSQKRRFSSGGAMAKGDGDGGEDEAEKMDVLWENFNEELSKSRKSRLMKSAESMEEMMKARIGCVQELKLPETAGAVATTGKTGKTAIVKVLRKLFLLHNISRRKFQTRLW